MEHMVCDALGYAWYDSGKIGETKKVGGRYEDFDLSRLQ
jgi:hypothetical protein